MELQDQKINLITHFLREKMDGIMAIYLFGSQVSGATHPQSDIDLAILSINESPAEILFDIQGQLAKKLKSDINLIDLQSSTTVFQYQILTTGQRIYALNDAYVENFENKVYQLYIALNEDRREIIEEILKSGHVYD